MQGQVRQVGLYFFLTQLAGIFAGTRFLTTEISRGTPMVNQDPVSGLYLTGAIILATALMLLLFKLNLPFLVKAWFYTAIFTTSLVFFASFTPGMAAIGLAVAVFTVRQFTPDLWTRNMMDAFSYAGAGALFGAMIGPLPAIIFLGVLAIYDFIAVYLSGHMVSVAEQSVDTDTFMGIIYPKDSNGQQPEPAATKLTMDRDGGASMGVVGGGDVVAPMIFSISLIPSLGIWASILSAAGASASLVALLTLSDSDTFYPAIPIIALGCLTGLAVYALVALL